MPRNNPSPTLNDLAAPAVTNWFSQVSATSFRSTILRWYACNRRPLPWRENNEPYRVWLSETMLQQTQVGTVIDYFQRFLDEFPDVTSLAKAAESRVLRQWEGLGYYRRARQLHAAARQIMEKHAGHFPTEFSDILDLPGVGRYTAGAIASIAFHHPAPIVEGNTVRLYSRLMGLADDQALKSTTSALWRFAERLVTRRHPGDLNQALMEVGSQVCKAKSPACLACPLNRFCVAFQQGTQTMIPWTSRKTEYESVSEAAMVMMQNDRWLIRRCLEHERWAGLWDFPRVAVKSRSTLRQVEEQIAHRFGIKVQSLRLPITIRHAVTKYRIELRCYLAKDWKGELVPSEDWKWVTRKMLAQIPLSMTGRQIASRLHEFSN